MRGDSVLLFAGFILLFVNIFLVIKNEKLEKQLSSTASILGYYRIRFGLVTKEDIENGVGITKEKIEKVMEELSKIETDDAK